jgi:hypothetical protein
VAYATDHIVVTYQPWMTFDKLQALHKKHGTRSLYTSPYGFSRVEVPAGRTPVEMARVLARSHLVRSAEPDYRVRVYGDAGHARDMLRWLVRKLQATEGSDVRNAVTLALLDTGIGAEGADLSRATLVPGWNFVDQTDMLEDGHGHGHGTRLVQSIDAIGWEGVGLEVMPIQALSGDGAGYSSWVADALYYAVDQGADVIHMGFLYPASLRDPGTAVTDAVKYAAFRKVHLVAPTCERGIELGIIHYPAAYPGCIAVPSPPEGSAPEESTDIEVVPILQAAPEAGPAGEAAPPPAEEEEPRPAVNPMVLPPLAVPY